MSKESTVRIRVSRDFKNKLDEIMDVYKNKEQEAIKKRNADPEDEENPHEMEFQIKQSEVLDNMMDFYFGYFMFKKFDREFAPVSKMLMLDAFDMSLSKQITASNKQLELLQKYIIKLCYMLINEPEKFKKEYEENVSQNQ